MKERSLLLLTGLWLAIAGTFAQEAIPWTLEKCIDYAHENNIAIKRKELSSRLYEKDYDQSKYDLFPSLGVGIEHQLSSGRSLNLEKYEWENRSKQQGSAGLRSDVTLFKGFYNMNNIKASKFAFLSSQQDLETMKNEITLELAGYYLNILFAEELLEVAKSQYEVTMLQVEKSRRLVEVGNSARSELLEIQAQAASEKLNIITAENQLRLSVLDLIQLLDLDSVGDFKIFKPDLSVELAGDLSTVNYIYEAALSNMPEIQGARYVVKAREHMLARSKGNRSPELYLSGLYYSRYLNGAVNPLDPNPLAPTLDYPLADQLKDNRYAQATLGLSIPVFSRFQTQTNISKAKIELADSEYALEQQMQALYKKIQQAHADALGALEKYNSAVEAIHSNEEAFNYTQQKYDVGLVNSVDFNIAKNNLTKARSELVQAKYEYIFKIKILDFYQGKPITF
jgi:outer membrane protein